MAVPRKIWLIWSAADAAYAGKITDYFLREGFEKEDSGETEETEKTISRFKAPQTVAEDSAVVLLSDEATADQEWQDAVRNVPESFRIIPIGGTVQIDYNDDTILPRRVQEINYIRPDEHCLDNLTDSLVTDPAFYGIRNEVMLMVRMWESSGRDESMLMSRGRKAKRYLRQFENVYAREQNPQIRAQGDKAREFLQLSYQKAFTTALRDTWRAAKNILLIAAGAALLAGFLYIRSVLNRAYYSEILLGVNNSAEDSVTTSIKIAEGITNPFVPKTVKGRYYSYLSELLEKNWSNSPLGMGNYKWALNDVLPSEDARYLYTANGKGQVVLWDSWTGEIVRRETVSENPLAAMSLSGNGLRAAIDSTGKIWLSSGTETWTDSGTVCPIVWTDAVRIRLSGSGRNLLVFDGEKMFAWRVDGDRMSPLWEKQAKISDAEFTEDGDVLCIICESDIWQACRIDENGRENNWPLGMELHAVCGADVAGTRALFADADGYLWIWDGEAPEEPINTEIQLSQPICLALSEGDYLVCHDRNTGTQLYDFRQRVLLAQCLSFAHAVRRLEMKDSLVMGFSGSLVYSEDIHAILPRMDVPAEIIRTLDASSDTNSGKTVKSISIENEYLIKMVLALEEDTTVVFDPSTRCFVGEAQADETVRDALPDEYSYYSGLTMHFIGKPTVVGILPEEDTVLIGGYDGSFYEICINEEGGSVLASHTQVPTHAAIRAVHQTAEGYYLEDAAGNYWFRRLGYPAMRSSEQVWLKEIRDKLRMSVDDELLSLISPQTADALNLHRFSASDGKEWE